MSRNDRLLSGKNYLSVRYFPFLFSLFSFKEFAYMPVMDNGVLILSFSSIVLLKIKQIMPRRF